MPGPPTKAAVAIAKNLPVSASFVQQCLDELNGSEDLTRRWLESQAPTGRYLTPSVFAVFNPDPEELVLKP